MANPTEALDAIEQALQELLLEYGEARHFDSGRTLDEINKERVIKHGFAGLTHLTTLKQQVAELVAFREVSTAKIAQLKRFASHKPGRESSFLGGERKIQQVLAFAQMMSSGVMLRTC